MKWYKVYLNGENRIWKKCITYSWEFMHENEEINFQEIIGSSSKKECQIKALVKGKGLTAKSISDFEQIRMPEFAEVSHLFSFVFLTFSRSEFYAEFCRTIFLCFTPVL